MTWRAFIRGFALAFSLYPRVSTPPRLTAKTAEQLMAEAWARTMGAWP